MTKTTASQFTIKRALLSVSDKRGIIELAQSLHAGGVEIVATGKTAALIKESGVDVVEVSDCTNFPEILDGRVKTLHPAIHAGLLARGKLDAKTLQAHHIKPFDLVVVNLYPFEKTISDMNCSFADAVENIDIGGPAMIRAAAKNHEHVTVIVSPNDYDKLADCLQHKSAPQNWRFELAKKAFAHTAAYDMAITNYLGTLNEEKIPSNFPETYGCQFYKRYDLRYGENPHQQAIFYADKNPAPDTLANAVLLQGKLLSYNNLLDADAALDCVKSFAQDACACVIVKHGNPCGIAVSQDNTSAYLRAFDTDPTSCFGGIIAFNQPIDDITAKAIVDKQFAEVIIAPQISPQAQSILANKVNLRVLQTGKMRQASDCELNLRRISGGILLQEADCFPIDNNTLNVVTDAKPSPEAMRDLLFAWAAVKHVKSNAIVLAHNQATIGIGAGQTSRVMSMRIALWQCENFGFSPDGAVLASDAFFPFADSIEMAGEAGISAVIQPGGSIRDQEVIDAANKASIAMVFTGQRHFRH